MKDSIRINKVNVVEVREVINGEYHRRTITPIDDISNEPEKIKDFCKEKFTKKVKDEYRLILEARQ